MSFTRGNYSIVCSLNERTIFMKIIDGQNYLCYEGNFDVKEFKLSLTLDGIYTLLCKCFADETDYHVKMSVNTGIMKLCFDALVGGFMKVETEILIREKLMSNDGQLTMNFNKLEQGIRDANVKLEKMCSELKQENAALRQIIDNTSVCILEAFNASYGYLYLNSSCFRPLNSVSLDLINNHANANVRIIFDNIKSFHALNRLIIRHHYVLTNFVSWSNNSLTELSFELDNSGHSNSFTSIKGIENFPNLKTLRISGATQLRDVPTILNSVEHKINKLVFKGCSAINVVELQTHCQTKGINLEIS